MRPIWTDEEVNPDEVLWRYFKADRLVSTLQSRLLYFPAARQFEDPFEGAVAVLPQDFSPDRRYPDLEPIDAAFAQLCRLTKISCWHRADYESDAMWKLYAASGKGVAVRTSAARLQAALKPFRLAPGYGEEVPYWGSVRYVDLHAERLGVGMEQRFFYKHRAFEWEREFRVVMSLRTAEESGVNVPEDGIEVPFAPKQMVECVYVGPKLPSEDRETVDRACAANGLSAQTSTLIGRPRYT